MKMVAHVLKHQLEPLILYQAILFLNIFLLTQSIKCLLMNQQQNQSKQLDKFKQIKNCLQIIIEQITYNAMQSDPAKNVNQFNKFLANNKSFLKEKYIEYYTAKFPLHQLQTKTRIEQSIKFIYDVFSFGKYQGDDKMNNTLKKSLRDNILAFVKRVQSQYKKQQADLIEYTEEMGVDLLKFCIQNNQMFAVHYDKKQKQPEKEVQNIQTKDQQGEVQKEQNNNQQDTDKIESLQKEIYNKQPQIENVSCLSSQLTVQAEEISERELKKQAKVVFDFYCKQQLNSGGPSSTFDKIMHQSSTMTLGKFMAFANTAGILDISRFGKQSNKKPLNKKTINQIFRKIGNCSKQIEFQTFFQVLKALNKIDNSVYDKLSMGKDQGTNKILTKLRYLSTPFNMKDLGAKQQSIKVNEKPYVPITTGHSGRFENSLKQDIQDRKQKLRYLPLHPYPNPNQIKSLKESSFIKQSRIGQSNLKISKIGGIQESLIRQNYFAQQAQKPHKTTVKQVSKIRLQNSRIDLNGIKLLDDTEMGILQNLIMPDDNDDDFLKEYKIPKLHSNIGLRKKDYPQINTSRQNEEDIHGSKYHIGAIKNRKNIVGQLKERIKQVEKTQRKQLTSLQTKRRGSHSLYNKV